MIKARHITIRVKDMERSLRFYREVLGLSYVRTRQSETIRAVDLSDGETNLTLLQDEKGDFGLDHIGFIVDDVSAAYSRLRTAGAEPDTNAPADFFKVKDPDGVVVDIAATSRGW